MSADDTAERSAQIKAAETAVEAKKIVCGSCECELPADSLYCPHCCGEDGELGARKRGAFIGGVLGLMAGGVLAAVWSTNVGPEQTTWGVVFGIALGCAFAGLLLGMIRKSK